METNCKDNKCVCICSACKQGHVMWLKSHGKECQDKWFEKFFKANPKATLIDSPPDINPKPADQPPEVALMYALVEAKKAEIKHFRECRPCYDATLYEECSVPFIEAVDKAWAAILGDMSIGEPPRPPGYKSKSELQDEEDRARFDEEMENAVRSW